MRALAVDYPQVDVLTNVRDVEEAAPGAVLVLIPQPDDAEYLNLNRPIFAQRRLRVVLFCEHATTLALADRAIDFFDWVSQHHECPQGPALHAIFGFRGAIAAGACGVAWRAATKDLRGLWAALDVAYPREQLRWIVPTRDYELMLGDVRRADETEWIACHPRDPAHARRFLWATAEARKQTRVIVVSPDNPLPGFISVHDRLLPMADAARMLASSGATKPACLAALLGLEPDAVELVQALLLRQLRHDELVTLVISGADPGPLLCERAEQLGIKPPSALSRKPVPLSDSAETDPVLESIRGLPDARRWAELAKIAMNLHEDDVASWWGIQSMLQSKTVFPPLVEIFYRWRRRADEHEGSRTWALVTAVQTYQNQVEGHFTGCLGFVLGAGLCMIGLELREAGFPRLGTALIVLGLILFFLGYLPFDWYGERVARRKARVDVPRWQISNERADGGDLASDARKAKLSQLRVDIDSRDQVYSYRLSELLQRESESTGIESPSFSELMVELAAWLHQTGNTRDAASILLKAIDSEHLKPIAYAPESSAPTISISLGSHEAEDLVRLYVAQPRPPAKLAAHVELRAMRLLSEGFLAQGRYEEAELMAKQAAEASTADSESTRLESLRAMGVQGQAIALQGRYLEGKSIIQMAIENLASTLGNYHIEPARLHLELARLAAQRNDGNALAKDALAVFANVKGFAAEREIALRELGRLANIR